eukprot:1451989-Prymnesium_polylepis.2
MRGGGRVAGKRYCCFCEACCLALAVAGQHDAAARHPRLPTLPPLFVQGLGAEHHLHSCSRACQPAQARKSPLGAAQAIAEGRQACGPPGARTLVDRGAPASAPRPLLGS